MAKSEDPMPEDVHMRVFELRVRAKCGRALTDDDHALARWAHSRWPKAYAAMHDAVHAEAAAIVNPMLAQPRRPTAAELNEIEWDAEMVREVGDE